MGYRRNPVVGSANPRYGYLFLFEVTVRDGERDWGRNDLLETTLKHELGHLFGVPHVRIRHSFMYKYCGSSYGEWTVGVLSQLNLDMQWETPKDMEPPWVVQYGWCKF
jgi:hypothetical protein